MQINRKLVSLAPAAPLSGLMSCGRRGRYQLTHVSSASRCHFSNLPRLPPPSSVVIAPCHPLPVNYSGYHAKSLHISVQTSSNCAHRSVDIFLYAHLCDWTTSLEEIRDYEYASQPGRSRKSTLFGTLSFCPLVRCGLTHTVLQGISDAPAWIVPKANQYAKDHGNTPFSIYQEDGTCSTARSSEYHSYGTCKRACACAMGRLGAGKIRSDAEEARGREKGRTMSNPNWERTAEERKMVPRAREDRKGGQGREYCIQCVVS